MIPKRIHNYLYILSFFSLFLSCQKNDSLVEKKTKNNTEVERLITVAGSFTHKNTDSAFYYYNKAKLISTPSENAENYVRVLNKMANLQLGLGDYAGSETTITEAIPYLHNIKNPIHLWNTYTTLGSTYLFIGDFNNAFLFYNKALALETNQEKKLEAKNNIATVFREQKKYDEALQIFYTLLNRQEVIKNPIYYAETLDNIGLCYLKIKNPEALQYLNQGLKIRKEINDQLGTGISYLHLSEYYDKAQNSDIAQKNGIASYKIFTELQNVDNRLLALKLLIKNSSNNDLKKYSLLYVNLADSIFEARQKAKNQFARIKYDSKKEKEENLKLKTHKAENELKLERQKNRNAISYVVIALTLCLVLVLYFYLTSKANREKIEAAYNSETRISKKLHDELANDIYHTMAFAENKNLALAENRSQLLHNLDAIYSRTRDISKENCIITTNENYIVSLKEMISGFSTSKINLILNGLDTIPWNQIDRNKKITVYRVLQELLVNMRKYSEATLVGINFKKTDKNVVIHYTDNGKGIDTDKMIIKNGLHNVESRIVKIKGKVNFTSSINQGFKVTFKFPI
ncbi:tetratricopeptide repeat-containing sensor histidine kinase [Flavobacterium foetidum]|uniref:tetratricopeptide repeat-containing sensor histidine kinase n=1 Tax=Flavobacterium foetidum TaxID=2026681 RepID=UPI00107507E8|nr:tetratricopeptide repeat protein [Flavobacterium foetidum]KAF2506465.1 tetratricopeptide repeat protein [Flavobacterium foetidum]